jgi:phytoene dehydrogenase-like protein
MARDYDILIVGGGHNGLVTAGYLARAGLSVLVLERRPIVGGACVTEEIAPGFRCSTTSYVCTLLRPQILRDLRLKDHGLVFIPFTTTFTAFPDGRHLLLGLGEEEDARQIGRYSERDAAAYPRFYAALGRLAEFLRPTLDLTPPDPSAPGLRGLLELATLGRRFQKLARADQALLIKMMTMSSAGLLDEWFESPRLKASLAAGGTIGIYGSPSTPGTAFVLLHYSFGEVVGPPGTWAFVRGGMGAITGAMAAAARGFGAAVRVGAEVERILVRDGAVAGVALRGGEEIRARVVASNADPKRTFLKLLARADLPEEFVAGIERYRSPGNSGKVNLALSELPDFTALPGDGPHLRGTIQVTGSTPAYLEEAFDDCKVGRPSRNPFLDVMIPSTVDDTLCPAGSHVMSISIKYMPYTLREGDWRARRDELGDLAIDTLAQYAPNLRRAVLHRQVLTPLDLEEIYGLTGGNICHGDMAGDQLFSMRPLLGWANYRTPIRNLYLCGSGAHPAGGVMGAPGRNAAREILRDLRRGRLPQG